MIPTRLKEVFTAVNISIANSSCETLLLDLIIRTNLYLDTMKNIFAISVCLQSLRQKALVQENQDLFPETEHEHLS